MSSNNDKHHQHHILPVGMAIKVGLTLLVMTLVTVWVAHIDLGRFNFIIAMAVATFKALLVVLFFMGLKYDKPENGMIFATSFVFLGIFMVLASTDLFFRGDVYVKGSLMAAAPQQQSKYKNPWISTPELVAKGKELFDMQCVSCHGKIGAGDGVAASALTPKPRNFQVADGWKNGRKPTGVFKTLKEGLPPSAMASFATLPSDDRWALTHYVLSLNPSKPAADTPADFAKIGVDPTKGGAEAVEATIPLDLAIERITVADTAATDSYHPGLAKGTADAGAGRNYQQHCAKCHGETGQGGIRVKGLGVNPVAYITTGAFKATTDGLKSLESFTRVVVQGMPGETMPGFGHLSSSELGDLYQFIRNLKN